MSDRPALRQGSNGNHVVQLQTLLLQLGYDGVGEADGAFGPATDGGVRGFQGDKSLDVDGIVGPATWAAIESAAGFGGAVL
jgi:peptidoglycan hydrolase-like protein with peptidoglycan-binding domain